MSVLLGQPRSFEGFRAILAETADGRVLVFIRARARGRGSGIEMDNRIAWVWTFRDDKAVRLDVYEEREEALEAVGLKK
jgi:ketosteroid isomerase-like protein